jgi:hypothetical protein
MIRLKSLLIEQKGTVVVKQSPNKQQNLAANIYSFSFRVKEISKEKRAVGDEKQWIPLSIEDVLETIGENGSVGKTSRFANGNYYYIFGQDLRKKEKREVYDVLILAKQRQIDVIDGKRIYSNVKDYLRYAPPVIGKLGNSDVISFKDFYNAIDPNSDKGEKADDGTKITGKYLRKLVGEIVDPKGVGAIEAEKDFPESEKRRKAQELIQTQQQEFKTYKDKWYWRLDDKTNPNDPTYYLIKFDSVADGYVKLSEYIVDKTKGLQPRQTYDLGNKTIAAIMQDFLSDSQIYISVPEFSALQDQKTTEQFNTMSSYANRSISNKADVKSSDSESKDKTTTKYLLSYKFKTHGYKQLTKQDILDVFKLQGTEANNFSLQSVMKTGSLATMIIQVLLKKEIIPSLKKLASFDEINKICVNDKGVSVIDKYDSIAEPVDGNFGTVSQNLMQAVHYISNNSTTKKWNAYYNVAQYSYPTAGFLRQNFGTEFNRVSNIQESKNISLKALLFEKNNLTYDRLFEQWIPGDTLVDTPAGVIDVGPEQDKKTSDTVDLQKPETGIKLILISGLHGETSPGYKSLREQLALIEKYYKSRSHVFSWENARDINTDRTALSEWLKTNPNAQVVCFSKGCEFASEVADAMPNDNNLWIVEPGGSVTIPASVPKNHVILGPNPQRGSENFEEGNLRTPDGVDHWGSLEYVGKLLAGTGGGKKDQTDTDNVDQDDKKQDIKYTPTPGRDLNKIFATHGEEYTDSLIKTKFGYEITLNAKLILGRFFDFDTIDYDSLELYLREDGTIQLSTLVTGAVLLRGTGAGWSNQGKSLAVTLYPDDYPQTVSVTGKNLSDSIVNALKKWKLKPEYGPMGGTPGGIGFSPSPPGTFSASEAARIASYIRKIEVWPEGWLGVKHSFSSIKNF